MKKYDDIIALPHHTSQKHPRMAMMDRAAQFSPFAALTGYEDAIEETGRLTDCRIELGEYDTAILNRKYQQLSALASVHPRVTITKFTPDEKKSGGAYLSVTGELKKIDACSQAVFLMDGTVIPMADILSIESDSLTEI